MLHQLYGRGSPRAHFTGQVALITILHMVVNNHTCMYMHFFSGLTKVDYDAG